ncbi:MAG: Eco57I restriction-modification methylase domain-containing protein, partial [Bacteroidota bacterium]
MKVIFTALYNLHELKKGKKSFDAAEIKKNIIQNSIYGVDIEKGAVDIARLRFWLALVVDEEEPHPLPNLDYKIMQGNSLLEKFEGEDLSELTKDDEDTDIATKGGQFELGAGFSSKKQTGFVIDEQSKVELKQLIGDYFDFDVLKKSKYKTKQEIKSAINQFIDDRLLTFFGEKKKKLKSELHEKEEQLKSNKVNKNDPQARIRLKEKSNVTINKEIVRIQNELGHLGEVLAKLSKWEHEEKGRPYFLWHTYFKEIFDNGKFDIIIGNPPYIKEYTNRSAFEGLKDSPYYMGKMDIWYFFACFCIDILKDDGGIQCFIAQNNWITSAGAAKFRDKVLQETEILSFVDFGNYKVFHSAGIQTMIYILKKGTPRPGYTVSYSKLLLDNIDRRYLEHFLQNESYKGEDGFTRAELIFRPEKYLGNYITFTKSDADIILDKIAEAATIKLTEDEVAQGIVPNPDVVNTRNIKRFSDKELAKNNIKPGDGVFVVAKGKFNSLKAVEKKYIKPIFEPNEVEKYKFVEEYEKEILY